MFKRLIMLGLLSAVTVLTGCGLFEPDVPPAPPSQLEATQGSYVRSVLLVWIPSEGADRYEITRATNAEGDFELVAETAQAMYKDTEVGTGRTYWYRVRACSPSGCSEYTEAVSGYAVAEGADLPLPPTGISATDGEYDDRIRITWMEVTGATHYRVHRAEEKDGNYDELADTETPHLNDRTAEPEETYWYKVRSCNEHGCSTLSSADSGYRKPPSNDGPPPPPPGSVLDFGSH